MDIQELRYFISTYESGSYAAAADKLFISRQALRQKLQRLEEELNGPLFLINKKKLEPTDLGIRLYQEAYPIVTQFDSMELTMQSQNKQKQTLVTMAMGLGAATFLSHDILLNFQQEHPQIRLSISENSDTVVVADVLSGKVDLGIVGAYQDVLSELDALRIQTSRLYLHVPDTNPLSQKKELAITDLKGQPFISHGSQSHSHQFLLKECQASHFEPNFVFCIQDTQATHAIARKHGAITWSYPPDRLEYVRPGFHIVPLNYSDRSWGTYIITQPGKKHSLPVQMLIYHLCANAQDV